MNEPATQQTFEDILQEAFGPQYRDILLHASGTTREIYRTNFGPQEGVTQQRVIKIDTEPQGPRAVRHTSRGYTTKHDLEMLLHLPHDAAAHHILPLLDFRDLSMQGIGFATVEPYFASTTLDAAVREQPLDKKEFMTVFTHVLDATTYLNKQGILHRDLGPKNILLARTAQGIDTRVTDLANATTKDKLKVQALPTAGARNVLDPLCIAAFTGRERAYGEDSEIYALAHNMYYALTGEHIFGCDPDKGILTAHDKNLLLSPGINTKLAQKELATALNKLPQHAQRYRELIRKGLSLTEEERYTSLDDFAHAFHKLGKPTLTERARTHWKALTATGLAGLLTLGSVGTALYHQHQKQLEQVKQEAQAVIPIGSAVNGEGLEVQSDLVTLDATFYPRGEYSTDSLLVKAEAGETLNGRIFMRETSVATRKPRHHAVYQLHGKAYIEGYEGRDLRLWPLSFDEGADYAMDGYYGGDITLELPEDITQGLHYIAVELYPPTPEQQEKDKALAPYRFITPHQILNRKRIPLLIGEEIPEEEIIFARTVALNGYPNQIIAGYLSQLGEPFMQLPNGPAHMHLRLPEESYESTSYCPSQDHSNGHFRGFFSLPQAGPTEMRIVDLISYTSDGRVAGYTFFPIRRENLVKEQERDPIYAWRHEVPPRNFSEQLIERRIQLEEYLRENNPH